jgi:hypothetical protein
VTAASYKILIDQGASCTLGIKILDENGDTIDLTGYQAYLQIREYLSSPAPLVDLSVANGGITIDPVGQRFVITLPPSATAAYDWSHGVFDMVAVAPDGTTTRLLRGEAEVSTAITVVGT